MRDRALWLSAARGRGRARCAAQGGADSHPRSRSSGSQIEQRFAERVKEELDLTDEQAAKLKTVATRARAAAGASSGSGSASCAPRSTRQIRDGAAADQDSVAKLTRELLDLRVQYAESWREEMGKLSAS